MDEITSLQNQRVKDAAKLREARERRKQGRTLIDGTREIRRAIEAGVELVEVFIAESLSGGDDAKWVLERLAALPVKQSRVPPAVFEKLAFGSRAEGIVAVAKMPDRRLDDIKLPANPLVAVLEGIEKPGNVGAVLRSADAAGVSALLIADGGTDLFNPNAIRASLGTIFTMPLAAAPAADVLAWLRAKRLSIFAARVDAELLYTQQDLSGPTAIVLGNESAGLSDIWRGPKITAVRLPMHGHADSLNISAAAAVLFYEAVRQRASSEYQ